jgi:hypothetical protein
VESFIRLADALGKPPGEVLDELFHFASLINEFHHLVERDPAFIEVADRNLVYSNTRSFLSHEIGVWCNLVDILSRSSNAERELRRCLPKVKAVHETLIAFAVQCDSGMTPADRVKIQNGLRSQPFDQLRKMTLLTEDSWKEALERSEKLQVIDTKPTGRVSEREINLTSSSALPTTTPMPSWPQLRTRIKKVAKKRGVKSALARECGVTRQAVTTWLTSDVEPGAKATLRLLDWIDREEKQTR